MLPGIDHVTQSLKIFIIEPEYLSWYSDSCTGWTVRGSSSGRGKRFFRSAKCPDRHWAHRASCSVGTGALPRGSKCRISKLTTHQLMLSYE
jgi:hypothetical protein